MVYNLKVLWDSSVVSLGSLSCSKQLLIKWQLHILYADWETFPDSGEPHRSYNIQEIFIMQVDEITQTKFLYQFYSFLPIIGTRPSAM